jgi:hypothetical protein
MTEPDLRPRHLRHDRGPVLAKRALMLTGFFLSVGTVATYLTLRDLAAGIDPGELLHQAPLSEGERSAAFEAARSNFTVYLGGSLFYFGLLVMSRWRAGEAAMLGFLAWALGRTALRLLSGQLVDPFLLLDLLLLGALWKGVQSTWPQFAPKPPAPSD